MRCFLLLLALTSALSARAENPRATALAREAERLYQAFKYKEAAEKLREAWDAEPQPRYLYNIARAYDQAGDLEQSLDYYREYTALPSRDAEPDLVKKANLAMDRLRTILARQKVERERSDAEKAQLSRDAKDAEARAEAEAAEARRQRREAEVKEKERRDAAEAQGNVRKLAAFGTGGLAAAALGTSLVTGIIAAVNRGEFIAATTLEDKRALEEETRIAAGICDVSLLVGLAAGVAAVLLYPKGEEPATGVKVVLGPSPGGGFVGVGGSF